MVFCCCKGDGFTDVFLTPSSSWTLTSAIIRELSAYIHSTYFLVGSVHSVIYFFCFL